MREVKVGDHTYRINRVSALKQFHIARKILPVLSGLAKISRVFEENAEQDFDVAVLAPLADALSAMPDKDVEDVILRCMSAVERKVGTAWARVVDRDEKQFMYDDIRLQHLMQLTMEVVRENLGDFLDFLQPEAQGQPAA